MNSKHALYCASDMEICHMYLLFQLQKDYRARNFFWCWYPKMKAFIENTGNIDVTFMEYKQHRLLSVEK